MVSKNPAIVWNPLKSMCSVNRSKTFHTHPSDRCCPLCSSRPSSFNRLYNDPVSFGTHIWKRTHHQTIFILNKDSNNVIVETDAIRLIISFRDDCKHFKSAIIKKIPKWWSELRFRFHTRKGTFYWIVRSPCMKEQVEISDFLRKKLERLKLIFSSTYAIHSHIKHFFQLL